MVEWIAGLAYGLGAFFLITGVVVLVLGKFSANAGTDDAGKKC